MRVVAKVATIDVSCPSLRETRLPNRSVLRGAVCHRTEGELCLGTCTKHIMIMTILSFDWDMACDSAGKFPLPLQRVLTTLGQVENPTVTNRTQDFTKEAAGTAFQGLIVAVGSVTPGFNLWLIMTMAPRKLSKAPHRRALIVAAFAVNVMIWQPLDSRRHV